MTKMPTAITDWFMRPLETRLRSAESTTTAGLTYNSLRKAVSGWWPCSATQLQHGLRQEGRNVPSKLDGSHQVHAVSPLRETGYRFGSVVPSIT